MVSPPFSDPTSKNLQVVMCGGFYWLKVAIERDGEPLTIHADTWALNDVAVIKDRLDADVTADWVTNELDPDDIVNPPNATIADTYDADHATYKGDLAAPDNTGLFSLDAEARVALKILVPSLTGDDIDYLSSVNSHTIEWHVLVSDGSGGTISITGSETFKVAPAGTFVFADQTITPIDILRGLSSSMDPEQIEDLVSQTTNNWFVGNVIARGAGTITTVDYLGPNGREAIIKKVRCEIFSFDMTAGVVVKSIREGPDQITYSNRESLSVSWCEDADRALKLYLREVLGHGKPYAGRLDRARESDSPPLYNEGLVLVG